MAWANTPDEGDGVQYDTFNDPVGSWLDYLSDEEYAAYRDYLNDEGWL